MGKYLYPIDIYITADGTIIPASKTDQAYTRAPRTQRTWHGEPVAYAGRWYPSQMEWRPYREAIARAREEAARMMTTFDRTQKSKDSQINSDVVNVQIYENTMLSWDFDPDINEVVNLGSEERWVRVWRLHVGVACLAGPVGGGDRTAYFDDLTLDLSYDEGEVLEAILARDWAQYPVAIPVEVVGKTFSEFDLTPDWAWRAVAGREYGELRAWCLEDGRWVVEIGSQDGDRYVLAETHGKPRDWYPVDDTLPLPDRLVHLANLHGPEALPEAAEGGPCYLIETRSYYGPTRVSDLVRDPSGEPITWSSPTEARAWAAAYRDGYVLGHGEYARPTYRAVPVS